MAERVGRFCNAWTKAKLNPHLVCDASVGHGDNIRLNATINIDDWEAVARIWKGIYLEFRLDANMSLARFGKMNSEIYSLNSVRFRGELQDQRRQAAKWLSRYLVDKETSILETPQALEFTKQ